MLDPLDLTIQHADGPTVDSNLRGFIIPSAEGALAPLWTTVDELAKGKALIEGIEFELLQPLDPSISADAE